MADKTGYTFLDDGESTIVKKKGSKLEFRVDKNLTQEAGDLGSKEAINAQQEKAINAYNAEVARIDAQKKAALAKSKIEHDETQAAYNKLFEEGSVADSVDTSEQIVSDGGATAATTPRWGKGINADGTLTRPVAAVIPDAISGVPTKNIPLNPDEIARNKIADSIKPNLELSKKDKDQLSKLRILKSQLLLSPEKNSKRIGTIDESINYIKSLGPEQPAPAPAEQPPPAPAPTPAEQPPPAPAEQPPLKYFDYAEAKKIRADIAAKYILNNKHRSYTADDYAEVNRLSAAAIKKAGIGGDFEIGDIASMLKYGVGVMFGTRKTHGEIQQEVDSRDNTRERSGYLGGLDISYEATRSAQADLVSARTNYANAKDEDKEYFKSIVDDANKTINDLQKAISIQDQSRDLLKSMIGSNSESSIEKLNAAKANHISALKAGDKEAAALAKSEVDKLMNYNETIDSRIDDANGTKPPEAASIDDFIPPAAEVIKASSVGTMPRPQQQPQPQPQPPQDPMTDEVVIGEVSLEQQQQEAMDAIAAREADDLGAMEKRAEDLAALRYQQANIGKDEDGNDIKKQKVDPDRIFSGVKGSFKKITVGLAAAFMSMSAGLLGRDTSVGIKWIDDMVERDIALQREEIASGVADKENAISLMKERFDSDVAIEEASRAIMYNQLGRISTQIAANATNEKMKAAADIAIREIQVKEQTSWAKAREADAKMIDAKSKVAGRAQDKVDAMNPVVGITFTKKLNEKMHKQYITGKSDFDTIIGNVRKLRELAFGDRGDSAWASTKKYFDKNWGSGSARLEAAKNSLVLETGSEALFDLGVLSKSELDILDSIIGDISDLKSLDMLGKAEAKLLDLENRIIAKWVNKLKSVGATDNSLAEYESFNKRKK